MNRWPPILFVLAMLAVLVVVDRGTPEPTVQDVQARIQRELVPRDTERPWEEYFDLPAVEAGQGPVSPPAGATGSTWYCPAGFATPDTATDHLVIITNVSDDDVEGTLTIFPALLDTAGNTVELRDDLSRRAQPIEIAAGSQSTIELGPLVASLDPALATSGGAFVAAMVDVEGTGITVDHTVVAFQGRDVSPCATSAAENWWFASGTTTADVTYQLYLLNPFPDDAVVDVDFVTDAGTRTPFAGKLIPAQSLTILDISPNVPVNAQASAHVQVRTGRVIAERIQLFENAEGPQGLSLSMGTNRVSDQWFFPSGRAVPGAGESYVIYNPGDRPAEVEFELKPDSADRAGDVAPLLVPVGSRERWIVSVTGHARHPVDALAQFDASQMAESQEPYFVSIRSFNGVPVVAERVITQPGTRGGVAISLGIDVASTDQFLAIPDLIGGADAATLAVLNPAGDSIARVQVTIGGVGSERDAGEFEVAPRRRASFDLNTLIEPGDQWIHLTSSTGTIAELTVGVNGVVLSSMAVPVQGTTSTPELLTFD